MSRSLSTHQKLLLPVVSCSFLVCLYGCSHKAKLIPHETNNPCGIVPIIDASRSRNNSRVQELLDEGISANTKNACGQTALSVAAEVNNDQIIEVLLKHGANIEAKTNNSATALVLASSAGNFESAQTLLRHGADVEAKQSTWTPLIACIDNHVVGIAAPAQIGPQEFLDIEKLLLRYGADVNARRSGKTALMIAKRRHFVHSMTLLRRAGAK